MLILFFDINRIIHHEFAAQDKTTDQHFYKGVLWCLWEAFELRLPGKWWTGDWLLYHDNAAIQHDPLCAMIFGQEQHGHVLMMFFWVNCHVLWLV
jgi:hypothetical protein